MKKKGTRRSNNKYCGAAKYIITASPLSIGQLPYNEKPQRHLQQNRTQRDEGKPHKEFLVYGKRVYHCLALLHLVDFSINLQKL